MTLDESNSMQVFGAAESRFNKLGSFHEKGADPASLQLESQDAWVTTLSVGARYLHSFAALESTTSTGRIGKLMFVVFGARDFSPVLRKSSAPAKFPFIELSGGFFQNVADIFIFFCSLFPGSLFGQL